MPAPDGHGQAVSCHSDPRSRRSFGKDWCLPGGWPNVSAIHKGSGMPVSHQRRRRGPSCRPHGAAPGFTLVELMVTIAVIAIIAAVAVPAMQSLINSNRLSGMAEEVTTSLQLARSEAVRRNARVTVCASADGTTCTNTTSWSRWIVTGRDNTTGETDVIRDQAVAGTLQLSGPADGIRFNPSGLIRAQQSLTVCMPTDNPADNQRIVSVLVSGSVNASKNNGGGNCP